MTPQTNKNTYFYQLLNCVFFTQGTLISASTVFIFLLWICVGGLGVPHATSPLPTFTHNCTEPDTYGAMFTSNTTTLHHIVPVVSTITQATMQPFYNASGGQGGHEYTGLVLT